MPSGVQGLVHRGSPRLDACRSTSDRPGPHPGHPAVAGGLPASEPGLGAGTHDLAQTLTGPRPEHNPLSHHRKHRYKNCAGELSRCEGSGNPGAVRREWRDGRAGTMGACPRPITSTSASSAADRQLDPRRALRRLEHRAGRAAAPSAAPASTSAASRPRCTSTPPTWPAPPSTPHRSVSTSPSTGCAGRTIRDRIFGRIDPISAAGEHYRAESRNISLFRHTAGSSRTADCDSADGDRDHRRPVRARRRQPGPVMPDVDGLDDDPVRDLRHRDAAGRAAPVA